MSGIASILAGIAKRVGAPIIKTMLDTMAPGIVSKIGGKIIDEIAAKAGVNADELLHAAADEPERIEAAILSAEAELPANLELWSKGLDGQFALLAAETKEGFWQSAWRWMWMYFLAALWSWQIVGVEIVNHFARLPLGKIDTGILMTLTSWFLALYMGGHTVKELGKNVSDAMGGVEEVNFGGNLAFDRADEVTARERSAGIARAASAVKADGADVCVDCGAPIPKQRRLAAPFARRCVACQGEMERGG